MKKGTPRIMLLGSTGFLGSRIAEYFKEKYEVLTPRPDVTDIAQVREALKGVSNAVVINATGKTGMPNVDWCETHRLETESVNITGAINVAEVAVRQDNFVIQLGSGCVFEGDETYAFTEEDEPNFEKSHYSHTKAEAERSLREMPRVCILRIRMPLSSIPHPKNLLTKLLQYKKILNEPNSVTVVEDLMEFIEKIIERRVEIEALPNRVFNAVNPGMYHHSDLLELYRKTVDPSRQFEVITLEQFEGMTKAKRSNCVLSTKKSEKMGIAMPEIQGRLEQMVKSYSLALR